MKNKEKVVACIVANNFSPALPMKLLRWVDQSNTVIDTVIRRVKLTSNIDKIYLCTSNEQHNDILEDTALKHNIKIVRSINDEKTAGMLHAGREESADLLVKIEADHIFTDPYVLSKQLYLHFTNGLDYSRSEQLPYGLSAEVMRLETLARATANWTGTYSSAELTLLMFKPEMQKCGVILFKNTEDYNLLRFTVHTKKDLERLRLIAQLLGPRYYKADLFKIIRHLKNKMPATLLLDKNEQRLRKEIQPRINRSLKFIVHYREFR